MQTKVVIVVNALVILVCNVNGHPEPMSNPVVNLEAKLVITQNMKCAFPGFYVYQRVFEIVVLKPGFYLSINMVLNCIHFLSFMFAAAIYFLADAYLNEIFSISFPLASYR